MTFRIHFLVLHMGKTWKMRCYVSLLKRKIFVDEMNDFRFLITLNLNSHDHVTLLKGTFVFEASLVFFVVMKCYAALLYVCLVNALEYQ